MSLLKNIFTKLIYFITKDIRATKFIIFEKLYSLFILNRKKNKNIQSFFNEGFYYPKLNCKEEATIINNNILKQNPYKNEKNIFEYDIDSETKKIIKKLFNERLKDTINEISLFYNQKIYIDNIYIKRNYGFDETIDDKSRKKEDEYFNNYFHYDGNTCNYFKLFINLHDTSEEQGPLNFFSRKNSRKFIKATKYTSRLDYNNLFGLDYLNVNTGKKGDMLFVNTTNCLHRASVPSLNKFRDMLFISFIATNKLSSSNDLFELENQNQNFWTHSSACQFVKKYSKPKTLSQTLKLFFDLNENKLNKRSA